MKRKFTNWHASQITLTMEEGKELETIEVPLKLSNIKPLHAKWLIEMCNEMTSDESRKVCLKGWKVSGIKAAAEQGLSKLPCLDRFSDIDPMVENDCDMQSINARLISEASKYVSEYECDEGIENDSDCEEWIDENQQDNDLTFFMMRKVCKLIFYRDMMENRCIENPKKNQLSFSIRVCLFLAIKPQYRGFVI